MRLHVFGSCRRRVLVLASLMTGLVLAGCGHHEPADDIGASEPQTVEIEIRDGQVDTAEDRVDVEAGRTVKLVVTSDIDDELHVHGVDKTAAITAGKTTTLEVTVDEPGSYDVEVHSDHTLLVQLLVR